MNCLLKGLVGGMTSYRHVRLVWPCNGKESMPEDASWPSHISLKLSWYRHLGSQA